MTRSKTRIIPPEDHVGRLVSPRQIQNNRLSAQAFKVKDKDKEHDGEYGLSVFWCEYYAKRKGVAESLLTIRRKDIPKRRLTANQDHRIAVLNVGNICTTLNREWPQYPVKCVNCGGDAHSLIKGLPFDNVMAATLAGLVQKLEPAHNPDDNP